MHRRNFLKSVGAGLTGAALATGTTSTTLAVEPFKRTGSRCRLSIAAYSFRKYFKEVHRKGKVTQEVADTIEMLEFVDYAADHGCEGVELTSYYFPEQLTDAYLIAVKRRAFLRGLAISGSAVGNTFTFPAGEQRDEEIKYVKQWIDYCAILGTSHIRVFAGNLEKQTKEVAVKNCIEALEECGDYAGKKGIFLGIENHGGIVSEADELLAILKAVKSPWIGINLDSANFRTADVYGDFAKCAPYAVNVQMKGEIHPKGQEEMRADIPRFVKILKQANYQGYIALEYESKEEPKTAVPRLLKEIGDAIASA